MALWTRIWHDGLTDDLAYSLMALWTHKWHDGLTDGPVDSQMA